MSRRILIIKSSSMGDVIHALPVAYDIKKAFPDCELDWVVEESFKDIPALSPFIDRRIVTAFRRWRKHPLSHHTREEFGELRKTLREAHYDCVIDIQGLLRTGLVARLSGAETWGVLKGHDTVERCVPFLHPYPGCPRKSAAGAPLPHDGLPRSWLHD